ncbi:DUF6194 family protein [Sphaerisporangium sp. B11E5]|uniref:DUF6194 family protein n=1 Tax=Sphaerisporangium sp. B11E5 TaxID=3153563 RepID=UPI00325F4079
MDSPAHRSTAGPAVGLTEADVIAVACGLPGVTAFTAGKADGAPEIAWGDTFIYYEPDGRTATSRHMPFATIVTKDYPGFDTTSDLDRPGVFRVNVNAGRAAFEQLVGYPPAAHADRHGDWDYTALDRLLPHPVYAPQSWVSVLNPGEATAEHLRSVLTAAHARAVRRYR